MIKSILQAQCNKNTANIVFVDILNGGEMFTIDGEELTPLEVSKLALYYSLNLEDESCKELKEL